MRRIGRAATWLTVAVMACVTTAGVAGLAIAASHPGRPVLVEDCPVLILAVAAYLLAIAPWWALAAVLGQQSRGDAARGGRGVMADATVEGNCQSAQGVGAGA